MASSLAIRSYHQAYRCTVAVAYVLHTSCIRLEYPLMTCCYQWDISCARGIVVMDDMDFVMSHNHIWYKIAGATAMLLFSVLGGMAWDMLSELKALRSQVDRNVVLIDYAWGDIRVLKDGLKEFQGYAARNEAIVEYIVELKRKQDERVIQIANLEYLCRQVNERANRHTIEILSLQEGMSRLQGKERQHSPPYPD